jgi:serine protease Do
VVEGGRLVGGKDNGKWQTRTGSDRRKAAKPMIDGWKRERMNKLELKSRPGSPLDWRLDAVPQHSVVRRLTLLLLVLHLTVGTLWAQPRATRSVLAEGHHKSGAVTLQAFVPVADSTRSSVVQFERHGERLALGTVIDAEGWILTKASEVAGEEFSCRLPDGSEVSARLVKVDDKWDIGLVRIPAAGLLPVAWTAGAAMMGQWAVTPGIDPVPEAVGILSASARRIQHRRALLGVVLDLDSREARIASFIEGLGAEQAGLESGDVVLAVNETTTRSREELVSALRAYREGETVRLRIRRAEEIMEVAVEMMVPRPDPGTGALDRTERMNRMGSGISARADGFEEVLTHDTVLQPWQCGGPLINLDGEVIGLNIARAGRVATYALPALIVRDLAEAWLSEGAERGEVVKAE